MAFKTYYMRNLILVVFVLVFSKCVEKKEIQRLPEATNKILIDIEKGKSIRLSKIFSSIKPIYLESPERERVRGVEKVEVADNMFFIWDGFRNYSNNVISVFDTTGNFYYSINNVGHGPGEYLYPHDFQVEEGLLRIYDVGRKREILYDFNGNFISEKEIFTEAIAINRHMDRYYTYEGIETFGKYREQNLSSSLYNVTVFNDDFEINKSLFPVEPNTYYASLVGNRNYEKHLTSLFFFRILCDTIYSVDEFDFKPAYVLDYGGNSVPDEFFRNHIKHDILEELTKSKYCYGIQNFRKVADQIYFQFFVGPKKHHCFFNETTKELYFSAEILNDVNLFPVSEVIGKKGRSLYFICYPHELLSYYKGLKKEYQKQFMQYIGSVGLKLPNINDNPIIIQADLK